MHAVTSNEMTGLLLDESPALPTEGTNTRLCACFFGEKKKERLEGPGDNLSFLLCVSFLEASSLLYVPGPLFC